jgi:hypothetical protein
MLPGKLDLDLYRGDDARFYFRVWLNSARTQPADLSEATAKSEIRDKVGATGTLIGAFTCTIEAPNIVNLTMTAAESTVLPGKGVWDLQLTYENGNVRTLLYGAVKVVNGVTDAAPPEAP